jgi:hypothetical protein
MHTFILILPARAGFRSWTPFSFSSLVISFTLQVGPGRIPQRAGAGDVIVDFARHWRLNCVPLSSVLKVDSKIKQKPNVRRIQSINMNSTEFNK